MRDLKADLAICEKATAGKWRVEISPSWGEYDNVEVFCDDDLVADMYFVNVADQEERINNAAFIVAAREGWPAAIDRAIAAEAEVSKLKEATVDMRDKVLFERERREKAESEVERLNLVLNERIADINAVLDDNESLRAMKLATDLAFMEQRKQIEQYRIALNRVLPLINDCPRYHGLEDGVKECAIENIIAECNKCWKIALGVEEDE